jgi:hypothetical protein
LICLDESHRDLFQKQIRKLVIGIDRNERDVSTMGKLYNRIFAVFHQLTDLTFTETSYESRARLFNTQLTRCCSSTLTVLSIKVQSFDACLSILDGRFNQLHTLWIDVIQIRIESDEKEFANEVSEKKMKSFNVSS